MTAIEPQETIKPRTKTGAARGFDAPRAYAVGIALVLFFVSWAAIAARPWQAKSAHKADPRVTALMAREKTLRHQALVVQQRLKRDWVLYQQRLQYRQGEIAAAQLRHQQEVAYAAAAAAAAASSAQGNVSAAGVATVSAPGQTRTRTRPAAAAPASPSAPAPAAPAPEPEPPPPPPTVRVVELPPEVQVVELPPITSSSSTR